jgi:hypothetical protein
MANDYRTKNSDWYYSILVYMEKLGLKPSVCPTSSLILSYVFLHTLRLLLSPQLNVRSLP